jgi:hypothetical protein
MHMKQILLASAAAMVMAGTAYAAEPLPEPLPPAPPIVEPFVVPSWAGPYVGADIGWGWADSGDDDDHLFNGKNGFFDGKNGLFDDDDGELDGPVGGVFAGWLGQNGTFLYGVELFAQIAEIDGDDDDDHHRRFDNIFGPNEDFFVGKGGQCFFDVDTTAGPGAVAVDCPGILARGDVQVHALFGLEGMIGWGGERAAFLLHAGPALGWFQDDSDDRRRNVNSGDPQFDAFINNGVVFNGDDDDDDIELGVSAAVEGRFKLSERLFAGVIGRAFWFPDVGDDDDNRRGFNGTFNHDDEDNDVTVFEVKARLGWMFGQPAVAAPVEAAF